MEAEIPGGGFQERQSSLESRLRSFADPQARVAWVVERAGSMPPLPETVRRPENEVKGCVSKLWLEAVLEGGRCRFRSDSESAILKAFASLLCALYDGLAPDEVVSNEPTFLATAGLERQLPENRRRTLSRVRSAIVAFAREASGGGGR